MSGCGHLFVAPTQARGGTLDLQMTEVPELVRVAVVAPMHDNPDHSSFGGHFVGSGCSKLVC